VISNTHVDGIINEEYGLQTSTMSQNMMILSFITILFAYLSWQRAGMDGESDIESRVDRRLDNLYAHNGTNYYTEIVEISVNESDFPRSMFKYLPLTKRRGYTDIRVKFCSKNQANKPTLPSRECLQNSARCPPNTIIRQVTWDANRPSTGDMLLRINDIGHNNISNNVKRTLAMIAELSGGSVDEEYWSQFKYK